MNKAIRETEVILFDLGNVVIELGAGPLPAHWLKAGKSFDLKQWFHSDVALAFERGELSALELARCLKRDLELDAKPEQIVAEFRKWPIRIYPELPALLIELRQCFQLAVLSNTNELHYPRLFNEFSLERYFDTDQIFASHLIRLAKPDPAAFDYVLEQLQIEPEQVLFLDDMEENVTTARRLGMKAQQLKGGAEVAAYLRNLMSSLR
ncbi:HAD family hydrolase [Amphritea balenae]|uniref:HAD family phosphatase n=1 Tax=Amphritea balenae TaxID=452629 RepID=A0A3P1SS47_9GAMM|nr:HAD family phosphatase [Amphritea balenae]RRD00007.1 HAD family phosphatase [Amphritea balenae]GGK75821.1 phosphatase [Amphritea balenae]